MALPRKYSILLYFLYGLRFSKATTVHWAQAQVPLASMMGIYILTQQPQPGVPHKARRVSSPVPLIAQITLVVTAGTTTDPATPTMNKAELVRPRGLPPIFVVEAALRLIQVLGALPIIFVEDTLPLIPLPGILPLMNGMTSLLPTHPLPHPPTSTLVTLLRVPARPSPPGIVPVPTVKLLHQMYQMFLMVWI